MVKGVEKLRQLEGMLGQVSWFGGGNALVDDVGSLGRGQPELPNFVARFAQRDIFPVPQEKDVRPDSCQIRRDRNPPLRKMLAARTAAYCAYGPVSPSKLNASLKSKAITDDLVNFSMK